MNNSQVAHLWANQSKPRAKGSNFYFEGLLLFSYGNHFIVAAITDAMLDQRQIVLVNEDGYSSSTRRHRNYAMRALDRARYLPIYVPLPATNPDAHQHAVNLAFFVDAYNKALDKATKAVKYTGSYLLTAEAARDDASFYAQAFNLTEPDFAPIPQALLDRHAKQQEEQNRINEQASARAAAKRLKLAEDFETDLAKWRSFERSVPLSYHPDHYSLLRAPREGSRIETSRGAEVPVADARALFKLLCDRDDNRSLIGKRCSHFIVEDVYTDKTVKIGCHYIRFAEAQRLAAQLGW